jgi:hypothetical protein
MTRFEKLLVHGTRDLRPVLHAQVVAEADDIDVRPNRAQKKLQVGQVDVDQAIEELVGAVRIGGQEHEEPVHAVEPLADFEQIAAEQSNNRSIASRAEVPGAFGQPPGAFRPFDQWSRRRGHTAPHVLAERFWQRIEIVVLEKRPVTLLEVDGAIGHLSDDPPRAAAPQHPLSVLPLGQGPGGHLAGRAIGKCPVGPAFVFEGEAASEFDGVDLKPFEHVVIDNRQLLDRIVHSHRSRLQSQRAAQLGIEHGGDT